MSQVGTAGKCNFAILCIIRTRIEEFFEICNIWNKKNKRPEKHQKCGHLFQQTTTVLKVIFPVYSIPKLVVCLLQI